MSTNSLEIKANIRNYIELNKTLIIFKLGRLELVRKPSILSPNGKSIIPPHNSCTFDDQIVNIDHSFVNYISTVNGKTKEENLELFKDFSNKIILEIEESGTAALEGFGYFFKRGNRILFSQNFEIPFKGSFGLPSINLSPIAKVEEDLIIKGTVSKPKLKVSNPYVNVAWNIIGTAAVFLLLVLGHRFITENKIKELK